MYGSSNTWTAPHSDSSGNHTGRQNYCPALRELLCLTFVARPLTKALGEPDVDRVEEGARAVGCELCIEEVDGVSDVLAVFTGQVVRVPYPKVRHSSPHTRKSNPSILSDAWLPAKSTLPHKSICVE